MNWVWSEEARIKLNEDADEKIHEVAREGESRHTPLTDPPNTWGSTPEWPGSTFMHFACLVPGHKVDLNFSFRMCILLGCGLEQRLLLWAPRDRSEWCQWQWLLMLSHTI